MARRKRRGAVRPYKGTPYGLSPLSDADFRALKGRPRDEAFVVKRISVALGERQDHIITDAISRTAALGLTLNRAELVRIAIDSLPTMVDEMEADARPLKPINDRKN